METKEMLFVLGILSIPFVVFALSGTKCLPITNKLKLAIVSFSLLYFFIIGLAQLADYQIMQKLYTYDLDGSGTFSQEEMTPEAKELMNSAANDTGRRLAPITGFIFSLFYVTLFFGVARLIERFLFRKN